MNVVWRKCISNILVLEPAVYHYLPVAGQVGLSEELSEQHAVCHVLQHRSLRCVVLKTNAVPHLRETAQIDKTNFFSRFS